MLHESYTQFLYQGKRFIDEWDDFSAVLHQEGKLTARLNNAQSYEEARGVFLEYEEKSKAVDTTITLSYIRHSIDTRDEFYKEENDFWDEVTPEMEEYEQEWIKTLVDSPFRKDFEREYGDLLFLNAEIARKTFSPEIVEDMQKENELVSKYDELIASAQVPFEGGVYTLSQLASRSWAAETSPVLAPLGSSLTSWAPTAIWEPRKARTAAGIRGKGTHTSTSRRARRSASSRRRWA